MRRIIDQIGYPTSCRNSSQEYTAKPTLSISSFCSGATFPKLTTAIQQKVHVIIPKYHMEETKEMLSIYAAYFSSNLSCQAKSSTPEKATDSMNKKASTHNNHNPSNYHQIYAHCSKLIVPLTFPELECIRKLKLRKKSP